MGSNQDEMLQAYLSRVLEIKESRTDMLSEEELRSIARDVGLSDMDLAAADQAAYDHFQRGKNYLQHGRLDDAILELTESVILAPGWLQYRSTLAQAYGSRWRRSGDPADREHAQELSRECLQLDPNHGPSYELLNELDQAAVETALTPASSSSRTTSSSSGTAVILITGLTTTLLMGGGIFAFLLMSPSSPEPTSGPTPIIVTTPSTSTPVPSEPTAARPVHQATKKGITEVPATIDYEREGIDIRVAKSFVRSFSSGSRFFNLHWRIENEGAEELHRIKSEIVLLDSSKAPIHSANFSILTPISSPELRPKDVYRGRFVYKLKEGQEIPSSVKVQVHNIETKPALGSYPPSKPLDAKWKTSSTLRESVEVRLRSQEVKHYKTSSFFKPVFEITNTGDQAITRFQGQVRLLDAKGKELDVHSMYMVSSTDPALAPGEVLLKQRTIKVPRAFDSFQVEFLNIK